MNNCKEQNDVEIRNEYDEKKRILQKKSNFFILIILYKKVEKKKVEIFEIHTFYQDGNIVIILLKEIE